MASRAAPCPFSAERDPMRTCSPALANRRASPKPSSPVPPMIAMAMGPTAYAGAVRGPDAWGGSVTSFEHDRRVGGRPPDRAVRVGKRPERLERGPGAIQPVVVRDPPQDRVRTRLDLRDGLRGRFEVVVGRPAADLAHHEAGLRRDGAEAFAR